MNPAPLEPRCLTSAGTPKARYTGLRSARVAARITRHETGLPTRIYRCPECHGLHVTTKPEWDRP